jgi:HSP20 family molecular chaperone IbpA
MKKAKQKKETGIVKAEPESPAKAVQKTDYLIGGLTLEEQKNKYIATIEIGQGITNDNIKVKHDKNSLEFIVSQKQEKEETDEKKGYHSFQSTAFSYYRKIPMPTGVDTEKITTSIGQGKFLIYLPKKEK